jgi:hypothetical protein
MKMIVIIIKMTRHQGMNCNSVLSFKYGIYPIFWKPFCWDILYFRERTSDSAFHSGCYHHTVVGLSTFFSYCLFYSPPLSLSTSTSHLPVWSLLSLVYLDFHSISFDPSAFLDFKWLSQVAPRFHYCVHMPRCGRRNASVAFRVSEWDIYSFGELCRETCRRGILLASRLLMPGSPDLCIPLLLWRSVYFRSS